MNNRTLIEELIDTLVSVSRLDYLQEHNHLAERVKSMVNKVKYLYPDNHNFVRSSNAPVLRPLPSPEVYSFAPDVSLVAERFNITLPKVKKGGPEWRLPLGPCWGQVSGLPGIRGKVILTNGVSAILIPEAAWNSKKDEQVKQWVTIHYDWFIPDDPMDLPAGMHQPKERKEKVRKEKQVKQMEAFAGM